MRGPLTREAALLVAAVTIPVYLVLAVALSLVASSGAAPVVTTVADRLLEASPLLGVALIAASWRSERLRFTGITVVFTAGLTDLVLYGWSV